MRKIVTAVSAAALSLSMLASAVPALAVTGYDSAYAGESAFVNISPGQTLNFQVFFANTGTTTWSRGTGTQVDLAACLEDKVTCNAQDASEASWNSNWLSSSRYATTIGTTTSAMSPTSIRTAPVCKMIMFGDRTCVRTRMSRVREISAAPHAKRASRRFMPAANSNTRVIAVSNDAPGL